MTQSGIMIKMSHDLLCHSLGLRIAIVDLCVLLKCLGYTQFELTWASADGIH